MATKKTSSKKSTRKTGSAKKTNKKNKAIDAKVYTLDELLTPATTPEPITEPTPEPQNVSATIEQTPVVSEIPSAPNIDISEKITEEETKVCYANNTLPKETNSDNTILVIVGAVAIAVVLILLAL